MDFGFLPFQLNADLSDFRDRIEYLSSDNGVDLYKAKGELIKPILAFQVTMINIYFFEGTLITVYVHLDEYPENFELVSKTLEQVVTRPGKAFKMNFGIGHCWKGQNEILALMINHKNGNLMLYFSLYKYSIF